MRQSKTVHTVVTDLRAWIDGFPLKFKTWRVQRMASKTDAWTLQFFEAEPSPSILAIGVDRLVPFRLWVMNQIGVETTITGDLMFVDLPDPLPPKFTLEATTETKPKFDAVSPRRRGSEAPE